MEAVMHPKRGVLGPVLTFFVMLTLAAKPQLADQQQDFTCPENGDPYVVISCRDKDGGQKPGFPKKVTMPFAEGQDINNDGKKDRLGPGTPDAMMDVAGNRIEQWCLQKSDKV